MASSRSASLAARSDGLALLVPDHSSESEDEFGLAGTERPLTKPVVLGAVALAAIAGIACILGARPAAVTSTSTGRLRAMGASEVGAMPVCTPDEVGCPMEWLYSEFGGYRCRSDGGCLPWSKDGPWPTFQCTDVCTIGNVPPVDPKPAEPAAPPAGPDGTAAGDDAPPAADNAPPAATKDDGSIPVCDDGEAQCPPEWLFGSTGGYYCRKDGGCSPWSKSGGAFDPKVCPDQCSIGNTPSTITRTTTTETITTTYPGMGIKLLCYSLVQPGYELDILNRQKEMYAGIFACNDALVLSFNQMTLGAGDDKLDALVVPQVEVGVSKDGTAGNALQFIKAWEVINKNGKYKNNDWVVKVDPDAVLLADRLRIHLNPHNGGNVYVRNCNKPMSEGTMMFGALEAISKAALDTYYANFQSCYNEVPWQAWGEDLFMMRCLEHVGVGVVEDFSIIQDGVCNGVWCGDNFAAAFHPMKSVPAWEGCWNEAIAAR